MTRSEEKRGKENSDMIIISLKVFKIKKKKPEPQSGSQLRNKTEVDLCPPHVYNLCPQL